MKIFIVQWKDIDDDCPKKSNIVIVGVFSDYKLAVLCELKFRQKHQKGYSEDSRCYGTEIIERDLNFYGDKKLKF